MKTITTTYVTVTKVPSSHDIYTKRDLQAVVDTHGLRISPLDAVITVTNTKETDG